MKRFTEYLDSLQTDPKQSAKAFWGFYGIFFFLIFLLFVFGKKNPPYEYETEEEVTMRLNKNYLFDYKVTLDDEVFDYYGKKDQDTELFKFNNNDYYFNESFYIKKDSWEEVDNPYKFYEFLNYDNYRLIINNAYYDSKDDVNNDNMEWHYKISSNTLNELLYSKNTDFEELPNDIYVTLGQDDFIKNITFNLDNFCLNNNLCQKSLKIELSFDMIDEIKEIDNPLQ